MVTVFDCLPIFELDIDEWREQFDKTTRIYHNGFGRAPSESLMKGLPLPDYIFVRNDGWSMGCFEAELDEAYKLWEREWVAVYKRGY
jgi:hypothetical protein